jgi:hypothetical protein
VARSGQASWLDSDSDQNNARAREEDDDHPVRADGVFWFPA